MSLFITKSIEFEDLSNMLWSGAKEMWDSATDSQRETVWCMLEDIFSYANCSEHHDMTMINDFIWFECDDIFYPEDDDQINDYYDAMKHEDDLSCDDWR